MTPVEFLKYIIRKRDTKLRGRADTIRRLLEEIEVHEFRQEAARMWLRGELSTDPIPKPWSCLWCGEMLHGGREEAAAHVQQCQSNPLVQQLASMTADRASWEKRADERTSDAAEFAELNRRYLQERQEIRGIVPGSVEDNDLSLVDCVRKQAESVDQLRKEIDILRKDNVRLVERLDQMLDRLNLLQKVQAEFREPERTIVCNILANGSPHPLYSDPKWTNRPVMDYFKEA